MIGLSVGASRQNATLTQGTDELTATAPRSWVSTEHYDVTCHDCLRVNNGTTDLCPIARSANFSRYLTGATMLNLYVVSEVLEKYSPGLSH
jgi:hypothetical protein